MKIRLQKVSDGLIPYDTESAEAVAKWKVGDYIEVEAKRPRNGQHHKKFFAMLDILYQNTDYFNSPNEVLEYIKIKTGIYKTIRVDGKYYPITGSIKFAKMDQDNFNAFYSKAIDAAIQVLPIEREDLFYQLAKF